MHKQIASTAFSLAVTLTLSILPPTEIEFSSDKHTQQPGVVSAASQASVDPQPALQEFEREAPGWAFVVELDQQPALDGPPVLP